MELQKRKKNEAQKDAWDKLGSITNLLASVIIAALGLYINSTIDERQHERDSLLKEHQLAIEEIDIVNKFMASLKGTHEEKQLALLSIQSLGKTKLAVNLALSFEDNIALSVLEKMVYNAEEGDLDIVYNSLFQFVVYGTDDQSRKAKDVLERVIAKALLKEDVLYCPPKPLNLRDEYIRHNQSEIGPIISEAMNSAFVGLHQDLSIINSGMIRANRIISDCIFYADVINIFPFGGKFMPTHIIGIDLVKILEAGKKNQGSGGYLQIPGAHFDPTKQEWFIKDQPLNAERVYTVLMNDFMIAGKERNLEFIPEILKNRYNLNMNYRMQRMKYDDIRYALIFYLDKKNKNANTKKSS